MIYPFNVFSFVLSKESGIQTSQTPTWLSYCMYIHNCYYYSQTITKIAIRTVVFRVNHVTWLHAQVLRSSNQLSFQSKQRYRAPLYNEWRTQTNNKGINHPSPCQSLHPYITYLGSSHRGRTDQK